MAEKERLDLLIVQKGLLPSREKAQRAIMAGIVYVNNQKSDKAGLKVDISAEVEIRENIMPYVSRGGLKLEKALASFDFALEGRVAMDVGASTGGFTDCMLKNGAIKVYAVDVGYGQLAWELRNDPRVIVMERTNIRYLKPETITDKVEAASIDVSFISLTKVLGPLKDLMSPKGEIICLVKPQFEAGREKVGKKGVVRDPDTHKEVIRNVMIHALTLGFNICGLDYSPIKGPEGNIEYLLHLSLCRGMDGIDKSDIDKSEEKAEQKLNSELEQLVESIVSKSHSSLKE